LRNINWLRIPSIEVVRQTSIDQNAFAHLTYLNKLHIGLCQCIEIDVKHLSHLKELGIKEKA
jgi:hypothetical protein